MFCVNRPAYYLFMVQYLMNFHDYQTALMTRSLQHVPIEQLSLDDFNELSVAYPRVFIPSLIQPKHYLTREIKTIGNNQYKHTLLNHYAEHLPPKEIHKMLRWWLKEHKESAIDFMLYHLYHQIYDHVAQASLPFLRKYHKEYHVDPLPFNMKSTIFPERIEYYFKQEQGNNLIRLCHELTSDEYIQLRPLVLEHMQNNLFTLPMLLELARRHNDNAIETYIQAHRTTLWHTIRESEREIFYTNKRLLHVYLDLIPFEHREILFYAEILDRTVSVILNKDFPHKRIVSFRNFLNSIMDAIHLIPEKRDIIMATIQDMYDKGTKHNGYYYDVFLERLPICNPLINGFSDRKKTNKILQTLDDYRHISEDPKQFFAETLTPWAYITPEMANLPDLHF